MTTVRVQKIDSHMKIKQAETLVVLLGLYWRQLKVNASLALENDKTRDKLRKDFWTPSDYSPTDVR
uniref:Uncharacterized protein n=1 Tax=Timema poppense TaxID=170557 RepID=A0A7R9HHE1_TIMPO|nr:unnamed protein product [Timema poppensis]